MEEEFNQFSHLYDKAIDFAVDFGPKVIGAILVLFIGMWLVKKVTKSISKVMEKRKVDPSLRPFLTSLISSVLKALLVISVMSMVGIQMTSFIALLGAAGLAIGMALSGTLQNFAGGVMILIFKPFKVGDFLEAQGYMGVIAEIQIFNTIITTVDNKTVIIPNGGLSTSSMINYSTQETRRVDFVFGIAYGDDLDKAKSIIRTIAENDTRVLKDPAPFVRMGEMADSSVNITTRLWVIAADYWDVHFDTMEEVYKQFNAQGINIPFPQMDVHIQK